MAKEKKTVIEGEVLDSQNHHSPTRNKLSVTSMTVVTKSNELIQKTRYSLPKTQQKLLLAMIAQINPKEDTDPNKVYTMSFSNFSRLTGADTRSSSYRTYLKNTIKKLADSSFWVDDGAKSSDLYRWISGGTNIDFESKTINMRFSPEIFPYLTQLKSNYTSFDVEYLLKMNSTYSMRIYEIILSYDNGETDYGYTNGIVFQPATDEFLRAKFPKNAKRLHGFKYKVFNIQDLKLQLSPAPDDGKGGKQDKPLTEKYASYKDFDKNVLTKAKEEINAVSNLWFDYIPARIAGEGRKGYQLLYLFIRYKTAEELEEIRENSAVSSYDDIIVEDRKNRKSKDSVATPEISRGLISADICKLSVTRATRELEKLADYESIRDKFGNDFESMISGVLVYVARTLTNKNPRKANLAKETLDALNRVLEHNENLKYWSVGMAQMMIEKRDAGKLKSAQYNAAIVVNAIEDVKIIEDGKQRLKPVESGQTDMFKQHWMNQFDE